MVHRSYILIFLLASTVLSLFIIERSLSRPRHNFKKPIIKIKTVNTTGSTKIEEIEARMAYRKLKVKEACAKYGLDKEGNDSLHQPNPWEFLINKKYHLVWCNIFKAASTSWMYNFNLLAGYKPNFLKRTNIVPLQLARRKYPRPSLQELKTALNTSYSFIIVRHPFERLLSAYRDKIQYALPNTPHQKLGNEIISKFRENSIQGRRKKAFYNPRWPTLPEFVNYLVDIKKKGLPMDMHWAPITEFCTPCQIHFDIIIKFETLMEDQKYLIQVAGLKGKIKPEWKNPSKGRVTTDVVNNYYSQLTVKQILQLYYLYRYDFELFEYSISDYLDMAKADRVFSQKSITE
ncbi:unnamed protein product [Nezara viridula]|uniref:Carbohydrate sulfotransferase n=1 Tax=Nezara viridula TaxID=85310 RepID=A0A9P0ECU5_NEZVI|nr:unnamed protein product [Nezara viridula]